MSCPIKSKLFWRYNGNLESCWYLGWGDGTSVAKQNAYINEMDKWGGNTITINLLNEGCSSPWVGEFMNSPLDNRKVDLMFNFVDRLKARGKLVVFVFFDCPRDNGGRYQFWKYTDRLGPFLEIATKALAPKADGFCVGIETNRSPTITANRGLTLEELDMCVAVIQSQAYRIAPDGTRYNIPVGTHEQGFRVAPRSTWVGYESKNHPFQGDSTPIYQLVSEVKTLVSKAGGRGVWVMESNSSEGAKAKAQNQAMAQIPGVVGVNCPV
jgi:hypothetical protein